MWQKILQALGLYFPDPWKGISDWDLVKQHRAFEQEQREAYDLLLQAEGEFSQNPCQTTSDKYRKAQEYHKYCKQRVENLEKYLSDKRDLIVFNLKGSQEYLESQQQGKKQPPPIRLVKTRRW